MNFRGGDAVVTLLDRSGAPFAGFSAARVSMDDVAAPLVWGSRRALPADAKDAQLGVAFRVVMRGRGAELFGISLRCEPTRKKA
jgi:hypothetical protein